MAGIIEVKDQGKVRIYDADNSNYIDIVVPSTVSSNRTITLPDASFTVPQADTTGLTGVTTDSGNVTITDGNLTFGGAGHGVHLGVTSATAANLLNDYEFGTFTPDADPTSGSFGTKGTMSLPCRYIDTGTLSKIFNLPHLGAPKVTICFGIISSLTINAPTIRATAPPSECPVSSKLLGSMSLSRHTDVTLLTKRLPAFKNPAGHQPNSLVQSGSILTSLIASFGSSVPRKAKTEPRTMHSMFASSKSEVL